MEKSLFFEIKRKIENIEDESVRKRILLSFSILIKEVKGKTFGKKSSEQVYEWFLKFTPDFNISISAERGLNKFIDEKIQQFKNGYGHTGHSTIPLFLAFVFVHDRARFLEFVDAHLNDIGIYSYQFEDIGEPTEFPLVGYTVGSQSKVWMANPSAVKDFIIFYAEPVFDAFYEVFQRKVPKSKRVLAGCGSLGALLVTLAGAWLLPNFSKEPESSSVAFAAAGGTVTPQQVQCAESGQSAFSPEADPVLSSETVSSVIRDICNVPMNRALTVEGQIQAMGATLGGVAIENPVFAVEYTVGEIIEHLRGLHANGEYAAILSLASESLLRTDINDQDRVALLNWRAKAAGILQNFGEAAADLLEAAELLEPLDAKKAAQFRIEGLLTSALASFAARDINGVEEIQRTLLQLGDDAWDLGLGLEMDLAIARSELFLAQLKDDSVQELTAANLVKHHAERCVIEAFHDQCAAILEFVSDIYVDRGSRSVLTEKGYNEHVERVAVALDYSEAAQRIQGFEYADDHAKLALFPIRLELYRYAASNPRAAGVCDDLETFVQETEFQKLMQLPISGTIDKFLEDKVCDLSYAALLKLNEVVNQREGEVHELSYLYRSAGLEDRLWRVSTKLTHLMSSKDDQEKILEHVRSMHAAGEVGTSALYSAIHTLGAKYDYLQIATHDVGYGVEAIKLFHEMAWLADPRRSLNDVSVGVDSMEIALRHYQEYQRSDCTEEFYNEISTELEVVREALAFVIQHSDGLLTEAEAVRFAQLLESVDAHRKSVTEKGRKCGFKLIDLS